MISDLIKSSATSLNSISDTAQLDCELLLAKVLNKSRSYLYAWPDKELTQQQLKSFNALLERRKSGEPVAHILGEREFWSLNLKVTKDTLIPRPDTEKLVELALELIPVDKPWHILDLGTGSGAIAIAIASERPQCHIIATDQSEEALMVAKENANVHSLDNIEFIQSNWFENIPAQTFNLVVSNPPYVCDNDPHLSQGDVRFEPLSALTSGIDGLNDIRIIIKESTAYLSQPGVILIEHGFDQAPAVQTILEDNGYYDIKNVKDYGRQPRVTRAVL